VIATAWSGQVDFLDSDKSILLGGELRQVPKSIVWKDIIIDRSSWFSVNDNDAYHALNFVFDNDYEMKNKGKALMQVNRNKFTLSDMEKELDKIMEKYTSNLPSQVAIKLPIAKKVDKVSEPKKIQLPKLKKVTSEEVSYAENS
jgi:hypothetical protein